MEGSLMQPDHYPTIQEFITWINDNSAAGIKDLSSESTFSFMPLPRLKSYFDRRRILTLLQDLFPDGPPMHWNTIRINYSKVFYILILIGKGCYIKHFTQYNGLSDQKLPFESRPRCFPTATSDPNFFSAFFEKQWMFCPHEFHYNKIDSRIGNECILPITHRRKVAGGGSADIYQIIVHKAYDKLNPLDERASSSEDPLQHTYALKTYNTQEAEQYYKVELEAYRKLVSSGQPLPSLLGFYGSYVRDGRYNLILEYADQGNLEEYFRNTAPPSIGHDIVQFWSRLFSVIPALDKIHELPPSEIGDLHSQQGWHQDIKPSNILVCSGDNKSPYCHQFKLADLGLSHFKKNVTPRKGPVTDADSYGTRAYGELLPLTKPRYDALDRYLGAPECYRSDSYTETARINIDQTIDIWSLGCVFSEAAVWVVLGMDGLQRYRRQREEETKSLRDFKDGNCFHNGVDVLRAVKSIHIGLRKDTRASDHVTDAVWNIMIEEMLEVAHRPSAKQLLKKAQHILMEAEEKISSAISRSSSTAQRPRTPPEPPTSLDGALTHTPQLVSSRYSQMLTNDETQIAKKRDDNMLSKPVDITTAHTSRYNNSHKKRSVEGGNNNSRGSRTSPNLTTSRSERSKTYGTPLNFNPEYIGNEDQYLHDYANGARASPSESVSSLIVKPSLPNGNSPDIFTTVGGEKDLAIHSHNPISQGYQHSIEEKRNTLPLPSTPESSDKQALPHLSVAEFAKLRLDVQLRSRDHAFLVNDSGSMKKYWPELLDLFSVMAYMVKEYDKDGIELHFSRSSKHYRGKHTKPLLQWLRQREPTGFSDIKPRLSSILNGYQQKITSQPLFGIKFLSKSVRPLNLYVFTDGAWEDDENVERPIKQLVEALEKLPVPGDQVGIQFIRFGNNRDGKRRLQFLDSGLDLPLDIVDTEPSDGNVWKMLLGAINKAFDGDSKPCTNGVRRSANPEP